jgi:septation ring formation regulator EzrA
VQRYAENVEHLTGELGRVRGEAEGLQTALEEAQAVYETVADYKQQIDELQEGLGAAEKLAEQVNAPEVHLGTQIACMSVGQ